MTSVCSLWHPGVPWGAQFGKHSLPVLRNFLDVMRKLVHGSLLRQRQRERVCVNVCVCVRACVQLNWYFQKQPGFQPHLSSLLFDTSAN